MCAKIIMRNRALIAPLDKSVILMSMHTHKYVCGRI